MVHIGYTVSTKFVYDSPAPQYIASIGIHSYDHMTTVADVPIICILVNTTSDISVIKDPKMISCQILEDPKNFKNFSGTMYVQVIIRQF